MKNYTPTNLEWICLSVISITCTAFISKSLVATTIAILLVALISEKLEHIKNFYKNIKLNFIRLKPEIKTYCIIISVDSILSIVIFLTLLLSVSFNKKFAELFFQSVTYVDILEIPWDLLFVALQLVSLFLILNNTKWKIGYTRILLVLLSVDEGVSITNSGVYFYNALKLVICIYFVIYFFKLKTTFKDAAPGIGEQHTALTDSNL